MCLIYFVTKKHLSPAIFFSSLCIEWVSFYRKFWLTFFWCSIKWRDSFLIGNISDVWRERRSLSGKYKRLAYLIGRINCLKTFSTAFSSIQKFWITNIDVKIFSPTRIRFVLFQFPINLRAISISKKHKNCSIK